MEKEKWILSKKQNIKYEQKQKNKQKRKRNENNDKKQNAKNK